MTTIRLGLIGDNIAASRSPALHLAAARQAGLSLRYELLIPAEQGLDFDALFDRCRAQGYRGVNVTLPYKERVMARLAVDSPDIARIGACNTVLFDPQGPRGFNTDYTGFRAAWAGRFGDAAPGRGVMFGAGGVGRAVGFALAALGAEALTIVDPVPGRAEALAQDLARTGVTARAGTLQDLARADGVVNATPLGMVGYGGSPVPEGAFPACRWAFDAVYTPVDTAFCRQASAAGARVLSGYALYFHQGIDAFALFTGRAVPDPDLLRRALAAQ